MTRLLSEEVGQFAKHGGFVDVGILNHGFSPHLRDYDVVFEALWGKKEWANAKSTDFTATKLDDTVRVGPYASPERS